MRVESLIGLPMQRQNGRVWCQTDSSGRRVLLLILLLSWLGSPSFGQEPLELEDGDRLLEVSIVVEGHEVDRSGEPVVVPARFAIEVRAAIAKGSGILLQSPELELPDGLEQESVSVASEVMEDRELVTYRVELEAREPAGFENVAVSLPYLRSGNEEIFRQDLAPLTFEVRTAGPGAGLYVAAAIVLIGCFALGLTYWTGRRRPVSIDDGECADPWADFLAARVEGDHAQAAGALRVLLLGVEVSDDDREGVRKSLLQELEKLEESCRFGGERVPREELDRLQRSVERLADGTVPKLPSGAAAV